MQLGLVTKVGTALGFCLLAGSIYFVSTADKDSRPKPQVIGELAGVRLGMSPTDVTLALGKPFARSKVETDGPGHVHLVYVYAKANNTDYSLDVTFHGANSSGLRAAVVCEHGGFTGLLGFDKFSGEQDIVRVLGDPAHTSIRGDGLEKMISYSAWNASFKIALGKIVGSCIHRGDFVQYDKEVPSGSPPL
jgi:hypothetical protein